MQLIVKYFFLADILLWGVVLVSDKYIFPWQTCFLWVIVDLVVLHLGKYIIFLCTSFSNTWNVYFCI